MATEQQEEVVEESDQETIQKIYGKFVETYGRKPRYPDHLRNFASKFHDVQVSFSSAREFLESSNASSAASSLFVPPKIQASSSISTPNVLTSSNRDKKTKLKTSFHPAYEDISDLQLLKEIKSTICNLDCIKNNAQILKALNTTVFNNANSKYHELNKRLAKKVRFAPSSVSRHQSTSKDETFLSLKKMSEATDISDVDHDTSVYLLRTFFEGQDDAIDDDENDDDAAPGLGLKEESLSLYDSMVIKYQKTRRNLLIDIEPKDIKEQRSAPGNNTKKLKRPDGAAALPRLSLTLNESIKPDFQLTQVSSLDDIFRSFSTVSFASDETTDPFPEENEKEYASSSVVQPHVFHCMNKYNDQMEQWDFDLFEFMDDPSFNGKGLVYLSFYLFRKTGLLESTGVSQPHLWRFLEAVGEGYLDNPYHNKYHAVDVILNTHYFFQSEFLKNHMTQWDQFAAYIGAVCHDLGHMGFNNGWYVNTAGTLALLYGDESVLENYHLNETFRLLSKKECNWMLSFPSSIRKYLATAIKECIIATDVKHHGAQVQQIQKMIDVFKEDEFHDDFNHIQLQKCKSVALYSSIESIQNDGFRLFVDDEREKEFDGDHIVNDMDFNIDDDDAKDEYKPRIGGILDERLFILGITIHSCDVANPCKPLELCKRWAQNYLNEAFMQGDRERFLGIPVSPGMDRDTTKLPNSQIGFIQYIVKKLFQLFSQLIGSKEAKKCLDIMLENEKYWIEEKKKQTTYKIAKKPNLGTIQETSK
eukprot:269581_1